MRRTENEAWAIFDTLCPVIIFTSFEPLFSRPKTHVPPASMQKTPASVGCLPSGVGGPRSQTTGLVWVLTELLDIIGRCPSTTQFWASPPPGSCAGLGGWGWGGEDTWCSRGSFRDGGGNEASSGVDGGMLQTVEDWFVPQPHPFFPIQQV